MNTRTKPGDIFSIRLDGYSKKYFQYIANDPNQLNSDVIRVFKKRYTSDIVMNFEELVKEEVEFYAHCVIKWGIQLDYWEKAGKSKDVGTLDVLFRNTNDYGAKPGEQMKISEKWFVWKIKESGYTRVGKLVGENQKSEIGVVIPPDSIVHRMKTGKYDFVYPDYE